MKKNKPLGIYIHIPFCIKKCLYCDFYSVSHNEKLENDYVNALVESFSKYKGEHIDTVYFGGGTPSILSIESYKLIFHSLKENFIFECPEITIEANPTTVSKEFLVELKKLGVNRISFGIQSFNDNELMKLGRKHSAAEGKEAVFLAKEAGFENISVDVMLGIVEQDFNSLEKTLKDIVGLPITHISAYILKVEENTPFNNFEIIKKLPTEDFVCDSYNFTVEFLKENGFFQYEISNFSKENMESRHNLKYWNCDEYLGFGTSAHSYYDGKRFFTPKNISEFISNKGEDIIVTEDNPRTFEEFAMLKLRLTKGLTFAEIESFNASKEEIIKKALPLEKGGLLNIFEDRIAFTKEGFLVSNEIISRLIT